jgi:hypothetical protein
MYKRNRLVTFCSTLTKDTRATTGGARRGGGGAKKQRNRLKWKKISLP